MSVGPAVAVAVTFAWLGMVAAISFLEAPLKFQAPNVTLQIGLGIGRLVFHALNQVEMVFVIVILVVLVLSRPPVSVVVSFLIAFAALAVQLLVVRPRLNRRSDQVLAGYQGPRSRGHYAYVGVEVIKAVALVTAGTLLLAL